MDLVEKLTQEIDRLKKKLDEEKIVSGNLAKKVEGLIAEVEIQKNKILEMSERLKALIRHRYGRRSEQ
jgi:Txe/YoeB family toxin of Txe-Axe toxin-antitoxin module